MTSDRAVGAIDAALETLRCHVHDLLSSELGWFKNLFIFSQLALQ